MIIFCRGGVDRHCQYGAKLGFCDPVDFTVWLDMHPTRSYHITILLLYYHTLTRYCHITIGVTK